MAADDQNDQAPVVLEQVIVTARKRNENLQNIPVAATVVSTEKLDNYGLRSMEAIAATGTFCRFSLRLRALTIT